MVLALELVVVALVWEVLCRPERYQLRVSLVSAWWLLLSFPVALCAGPYEMRAFQWAYSHRVVSVSCGVLVLVLVDDFLHYWVHRGAHYFRVAWWLAHRVHHSATDFNLLVAVRFSFVGHLLGASAPWVALASLGFPVHQVIAVRAWNMLYQWTTHLRWTLPWGLERWFVTGQTHSLHHASNVCYWDGNYGAMLSVWDRWFGTSLLELPGERVVYGVNRGEA